MLISLYGKLACLIFIIVYANYKVLEAGLIPSLHINVPAAKTISPPKEMQT